VRTYRQLFALAEFRMLFAGQLLIGCAMTMQSLALSVLVYARTGSPFLAAVAYLGGYVPQAIGVMLFSSVADRQAPRSLLVGSDALRLVSFAVLAVGALPIGGVLAVVMICGLGYGALGGVRYLMLAEMLPTDGYILGRSALTMAVGGTQIVGFAVGGALLAALAPTSCMWIATAIAAAALTIDRFGLQARDSRAPGRPSIRASWRVNRALLSNQRLRWLLAAQWVPNGLIVGAEALYVPYAGTRAAALFIASATGMLAGDFIVGRFVPASLRPRLTLPLYLLLAGPYLAFAARPSLALATTIVAVASLGYGGTLGLQQVFADALDPAQQGQAFSLAAAGQMSSQGLAAWGAGALAEPLPVGGAIAAMAGLSILASVVLVRVPHEMSSTVRPRSVLTPTVPTEGRTAT
jgi:MFS family permease